MLDANEKSRDLENTLKDVTKELQSLNKEKEVIEKRRTEALKKHTELELDAKDLQEKISGNIRAKVLFSWYPIMNLLNVMVLYLIHFAYMCSGRCCKTTRNTWERNSGLNGWAWQN